MFLVNEIGMEGFMEERLLVKRAKRGDVDAFAKLYEKIYKKLYAFALYTLKRPEDAEDVVSAAVMDAFETIGKLKKDEAFSGWIFRIVANKCNQKMREYYKQGEELTEELMEMAGETESCWDDTKEENLEVRQTFFELSEEERRIIGMHVFFGYKTREIADVLGMNENTVRSKESRALKRMESRLRGLSLI